MQSSLQNCEMERVSIKKTFHLNTQDDANILKRYAKNVAARASKDKGWKKREKESQKKERKKRERMFKRREHG